MPQVSPTKTSAMREELGQERRAKIEDTDRVSRSSAKVVYPYISTLVIRFLNFVKLYVHSRL